MLDNLQDLTDIDVIQFILDGNVDAFSVLLKRYQRYVFSITYKYVAPDHVEEISHEVFISAFKSLKNFSGKSDFKFWLAKITVRRCYDYLRKKYRRKEQAVDFLDRKDEHWVDKMKLAQNDAYKREADRRELREMLNWSLNRLPPQDRMVLQSVYIDGLSLKETAELLDITVMNVKVRSFRAKRKLKKILSEVLDDELR
ncbi:MAG: sigma-70 family RNA polymerase sigma factor [Candidatus Omnitrophica bacterium]|nr:sigma-70 family RNA polymerase sigma factor [Candidatus Omnitrophota bacterium]